MSTLTPRLGLLKAAAVGEVVDVQVQITDAFDLIDAAAGATPVTSGTMPAAPYDGQIVKQTDTRAICFYMASVAKWYIFDVAWQTWGGKAAQPGKHVLGSTLTPNVGTTGSDVGRYMRQGNMVHYEASNYANGTGIVGGQGTIVIPLPFDCAPALALGTSVPIGHWFINDAGTAVWSGVVVSSSTTNTEAVLVYPGGLGPLTFNGSPFATAIGPTPGDNISVKLAYPSTGVPTP